LGIHEVLADYVVKTGFEDLPERVVEQAKICTLDLLGCALGGYKTDVGRMVVDQMKSFGGKRESTIIGDGAKVPCTQAAFANAVIADILDFEDTYVGHPAATIIPGALAVGERVGASGRDFITSIVLGYEVSIRIGVAVQPSAERFEKIWPMVTWHTYGASIPAAKLLRLDREGVVRTIEITGTTAPVPCGKWYTEMPRSYVKGGWGWGAESGVLAALLAEKGFHGMPRILESERGFWLMCGSDKCDFDFITARLGERYEIMNLAFKPHSSCRWTHATLDAVKLIIGEHNVKADEVEEVKVRTTSHVARAFPDYAPESLVDAEFSIPYTVAVMLLRKKPGPDWFAKKTLTSKKVLNLASKVKLEADPEADDAYFKQGWKLLSKVTVKTKDGKLYEKTVDCPKGEPQNPMTAEELKDKFVDIASGVAGKKRAEKLLETIYKLDRLKNISALTRLLVCK